MRQTAGCGQIQTQGRRQVLLAVGTTIIEGLADKVPQKLKMFCELELLWWTLVKGLRHLRLLWRAEGAHQKVFSSNLWKSHKKSIVLAGGGGVRTPWPATFLHRHVHVHDLEPIPSGIQFNIRAPTGWGASPSPENGSEGAAYKSWTQLHGQCCLHFCTFFNFHRGRCSGVGGNSYVRGSSCGAKHRKNCFLGFASHCIQYHTPQQIRNIDYVGFYTILLLL